MKLLDTIEKLVAQGKTEDEARTIAAAALAKTVGSRELSLFAPLSKVEDCEDGTCFIEGIATAEVIDSDGEVVLFEPSVEAFEGWSSDMAKISGGENLGNIREMHLKIAAGKAVSWFPDAEGAYSGIPKSVVVRGHVVDPVAVAKCKTRVYNGFSIHAPPKSVKRELRKFGDQYVVAVTKYEMDELTLADRPSCPVATFVLAKREGAQLEGLSKAGENAAQVALQAEDVLAGIKALMSTLLSEKDPSTWTLHDMVSILETLTGLKYDAEIAAAIKTTEGSAAPNASAIEEAPVEKVAGAAKPSDGLSLLDKAIEMHQTHLDDPETATPESQKEMMDEMKAARKALSGEMKAEKAAPADMQGKDMAKVAGTGGQADQAPASQAELMKAVGAELTKAAVTAAREAVGEAAKELRGELAKMVGDQVGPLKEKLEKVAATPAEVGTVLDEPEKVLGSKGAGGEEVKVDHVAVLQADGIIASGDVTRARTLIAAAAVPGLSRR